jgi:hypothetical protein
MMASFYNHRAADVVRSSTAVKRQNQPQYLTDDELSDPDRMAMPAYWVDERELPSGMPDWLIGYSWVSSPTNERTMIAYPLPKVAAGNSMPIILSNDEAMLLAMLCSYPLDYALRQKLGGVNLTYGYVQQLPSVPVDAFAGISPWDNRQSLQRWILHRLARLVFTAVDMTGFAKEYGLQLRPYRWDPLERLILRCELDATFFRLYGIDRDDVDYIMETFAIVKRKDIAAHGEYQSKRLILEIYDAMAEAEATGAPYMSPFEEVNVS